MTLEERRDLSVGEKFTVSLPSNPTTGFDWQVEFPPEQLRLDRREYDRDSDLIGSGGTTTFTLSGLKPGEAVVRFRYLRVWEGKPVDERVVHVKIAPAS